MNKLRTLAKSGILFITLFVSLKIYYNKQIGTEIDKYNNVPVYFNSIPFTTDGTSRAKDGYIFGKKYSNIEFINRYYYDIYNQKLGLKKLNLSDLKNGEKIKNLYYFDGIENAKSGDIIISKNVLGDEYMGIITKIEGNKIELIRQNFWKTSRITLDENKGDIIGILSLEEK